jgi:hypothetical protein
MRWDEACLELDAIFASMLSNVVNGVVTADRPIKNMAEYSTGTTPEYFLCNYLNNKR